MKPRPQLPEVGPMDPELNNSPIAEELDEDVETLRLAVPGEPVCYFNGRAYPNGTYVRSGTQVLKCQYGIWLDTGSADPYNP
jgi:hypothetical protein